jgi:hypothetical protein
MGILHQPNLPTVGFAIRGIYHPGSTIFSTGGRKKGKPDISHVWQSIRVENVAIDSAFWFRHDNDDGGDG